MHPRHERFARTLAVTGDATESAARVGYKPGNGLKVTAHRLTRREDVEALVTEERDRLAQGHQISNDRIIGGLGEIAQDRTIPAAARATAYRTLADIRA